MTRGAISTLALARSLTAIGWAATILVATAGSAAADVFSINATLTTPDGVIQVGPGSQDTPIMSTQTHDAGSGGAAVAVTYGVKAKPGELGSVSDAAALAASGSINGVANAIAGLVLDNFEITVVGAPAGTPVNYTINFEISGRLGAVAFGSSSAFAQVVLSYDFAPGDGVTLGEAVASTFDGSGGDGIFSHGTEGVITHTPVETGFVDLDHHVDIYTAFLLDTHAAVGASPTPHEDGKASASADFIDPFSLRTDGPVFNFFDASGHPLTGVTVDSSDGCIVNNRFLCGGAPTGVPEPSVWTMMLLGFAGLGYAGWRNGRERETRRPAC
jgi:hypothetical protein